MTTEEIKEQVTMRDVLSQYGIQVNRSGMCSCPFHTDKHPSMKVFKDGFKCFSCNKGGDVFTFVREMEHCSFKDAFLHLGGTYDNGQNELHKALINKKFEQSKIQKQQKENAETEFKRMLEDAIENCSYITATRLLYSEPWTYATNKKPWLENVWDLKYLEGEEVNEVDVITVCRKIERICNFVG